MAKFYPVNIFEKPAKPLQPKKETITFLLNYSRALYILKGGKMDIEVLLN